MKDYESSERVWRLVNGHASAREGAVKGEMVKVTDRHPEVTLELAQRHVHLEPGQVNLLAEITVTRARAHTHTHTRAHARTHTDTHTHARTRAHTHTHTHTHTLLSVIQKFIEKEKRRICPSLFPNPIFPGFYTPIDTISNGKLMTVLSLSLSYRKDTARVL